MFKPKFSLVLAAILFAVAIPSVSLGKTQTEPALEGLGITSSTIDRDINAVENLQPQAEIPDVFYKAKVMKILDSGVENQDGHNQEWQSLQLQILNGDQKGKNITINNGKSYVVGAFQKYKEGETVVVAKSPATPENPQEFYFITDRYRGNDLIIVTLIFFALAIYFGRRRGFSSIVGMLFSVLVIFYYIIPHISKGGDPLWTCVAGAIAIILLSLYLSHGFNKRTTIALLSTLVSLALAVVIDIAFVHIAKLAGTGTEEAFYLQFDNFSINLQGLLLGGIIIGVLGVLDDVTTGQAAAIEEIYAANNSLTFEQLYRSGLSVGREHIASLINTLVLAYAGASFPLLLLYSTQGTQPLWVTLNSNFIAEEIIRTLVGSAVLVIAVPLTTFFAAFFYSRKKISRGVVSIGKSVVAKEEMVPQPWKN